MLENLSSADFSKHLHTKFLIHYQPEQSLEAELVEVSERKSPARQERFWLLFRGPREPLLQQATYRLEHEAMGVLDLFLVPVEMDEAGIYYEAVFNRIHREPRE